jgi:hypothetical protein
VPVEFPFTNVPCWGRHGAGRGTPTDVELARLLAAVRKRIIRLPRRHDIDLEGNGNDGGIEPFVDDPSVLEQLPSARRALVRFVRFSMRLL